MIGTQIGPFHVMRLLGAGGMGSVYLAEHALMKDLHAIKVLDPQLTKDPQLVTRFVNEARAAARLRHRNLVRVHNIDRLPGDGAWYMVLDYLDGNTLGRLLASCGGPMPVDLVVHILAQVASCIQHVHDHRIVHRDLKPDNIFVIHNDDDPYFPVVLDLGVAQLSEDLTSGRVTRTGTVIGTPTYMAPEQLRGERVSPAADIFALGVIAYELSTGGWFPFQYDDRQSDYFELPATELYYRQRSLAPCDPRRRCPGLGDDWVAALMAALALDPRRRPASARDFALALAAAVPAHGNRPGGVAIVHQVARELVTRRSHELAVRPAAPGLGEPAASLPAAAGAGDSAPRIRPPERTTVNERTSTLASAASQALARPRQRPRWQVIAGGTSTALVVGAMAAFAIARLIAAEPGAQVSVQPAAKVQDAAPGPASSNPARADGAGNASADRSAVAPPGHLAAPRTGAALLAGPGGAGAATPEPRSARPAIDAMAGAPRPPAPPVPGAEPAAARVVAPRSSASTGQPASTTARRTGELAVLVKPWAMIWLDGRPLGQTPFRQAVAAGRHRLRLSNDDLGKDETTVITVHGDQTTTVQRSW